MTLLKRVRRWFQARKANGAQELDDELRFHLEKEIELNLRRGMTPEEARRHGLLAFGGVQQVREAVRRQRSLSFIETLWQDVAFGARVLRKAPGFTAITVAILALGIGANTAIFSAVNTILFARWPVPHQEQLVLVKEVSPANEGYIVSVPDFEDYRGQQSTFQQLSLWLSQSINLTGPGAARPDRLIGAFVSDNFLELLGVKVSMGRGFLPGDDAPGAGSVAIIAYDAWQTRFGADPAILGRQLTLNNEPSTVVGVLPKGFSLAAFSTEVYLPAHRYTDYKVDRQQRSFLVFGRMKDGVTRARATADLDTIAQRLARDSPTENAGIHIELTGLQELSTRQIRAPLLALLGAVAMVLLVVCANVANLLMARGAAREREVAVRAALGASRGRLVRQFLSESLLLAVIGGSSGVLLGVLLLQVVEKIRPVDLPVSGAAVLDLPVLLFAAGASALTGILFGLAPALQFSRTSLTPALSGGPRTAGHPPRGRLRSAFVVCQVAISLALLVSAGLLIRSFRALLLTNPGFVPDHLLTMEYRLPTNKYKTAEAQTNFHRLIVERVRLVPGVVSAAVVQALPFSGNWGQAQFDLPSPATVTGENSLIAFYDPVTPGYFSTMGLPLLEGREFNAHDDERRAAVAVISQNFARKYFSDQDPIGREVKIKANQQLALAGMGGTTQRATVVGVVGNARQRNVREVLQPQIYFPYAQVPGIFGTLVVRAAVEPMSLSEAVRQAVWSVDKDQPVWKVRTVDFLIARDTAPDRFAMLLMSALSALALMLSALGTYGMLSNTVHQRTRELGVRMALGASKAGLLKLVLMQGLKLLAAGGALGLAGAIVSARLIASLLYGVTPGDPTTFLLGLAAMLLIGVFATYLPARRATRVDPLVALRYE